MFTYTEKNIKNIQGNSANLFKNYLNYQSGRNSRPYSGKTVQHRFDNDSSHNYGEECEECRKKKLDQPFFRRSDFSIKNGFKEPSIHVKAFNQFNKEGNDNQKSNMINKDKSTSVSMEDQDQNASLSSFATTARGVSITVEPEGVYSSNEYPDGFRWTQTIETNVEKGGPILAARVNYVDPKPNDDTKPFYWTDAENITHKGTFKDRPSRNPRAGGTVVWDATLSLNGINGKNVTRFDSLTYGFSVESGGKVTQHAPATPADVSGHLSTLKSEFSGWTFQ